MKIVLSLILILFTYFSFSQDKSKIDSLKNIAKSEKTNDDFYYNLAIEYYNYNFDSVLYFANKAINYCKKDNLNKARYYLICGVANKNTGNPGNAIQCYKSAEKIFYNFNNPKGIASAKNNLGLVYTEIGDYEKATNEFIGSIKIFKKLHDTLNVAEVYLNLGELNVDINNATSAINYFNKARKFYKLLKSELGKAFVFSGIGDLKIKENKLDSALYYYTHSAKIWKQANRLKEYAKSCNKIGDIYSKKKQFNKALYFFETALNNFEIVNYQYGIAQSAVNLGNIYIKKNNLQKATEYNQKAIQLSKDINSKSILADAYKNLFLIEKSKNNFAKALKYYEHYNLLRDSLLNENTNKNIADIQAKYQLLRNQKQIENLRDSTQISSLIIEKNKLQAQQQKRLTWILIAGVIIAILFIFLIYHRFKTKKMLSQKLYSALSDREVLLKELHHRVKNNLQIISSLLNLQSEKTKNNEAKEILQISKDRITSMVIIHEKLYRSKNFKTINLQNYINDLVNNLSFSADLNKLNIQIKTDVEEIILDINKLIPCGLIINELITNSIKHAFKNTKGGKIFINGKITGNLCKISIADNGKGLPDNFKIENTNSLGLRLVKGLTKQINGKFNIEKTTKGSKFFIIFKP